MLRAILSLAFILPVYLFAQVPFEVGTYLAADRDPVRNIVHFPNVVSYDIPENEVSQIVGPDHFRWDSTGRWLRADLMKMRSLNIYYLNEADGVWYHVGKGFVRGFGCRVPCRWNGRYVVEIGDSDYPIVMQIERKGSEFVGSALVVGDPGH